MRKTIYLTITLFFMLIIVVACGAKDDVEDNDVTDEVNNESTNEESKDKKDSEENKEAEESKEDEVAEDKNKDPLYTIDEIWRVVPIEDANPEVALITIDDAPDQHALEMAHTLNKLDAPAIFFVNGHFMETEEEKEIIKEIHDLGFMIGNHTYSHADLQTLSDEEQYDEIVQVSDMVEEITGERPKFFRAPFGQNTDYSRLLVEDEDMVLMNWTLGYDWEAKYQTKEALTDIMLNSELLNDGANLLMHDRDWTNAALEDIVIGLRNQGYELVDPKQIETKE